MRDKRDSNGRVSKRSSTGIRRDAEPAERREPIRNFDEADQFYRESGRDARSDRHRDDRRRDDRREYDREEERRFSSRQDRYDDRYDDHRDRRRDDYDRRDERRDDYGRREERKEAYRRDYERDERRYDTMHRSSRREAPRWDDYRFDEDEPREARREDVREEPRERRSQRPAPKRRTKGRRVGGDTELFVHQIVPYAMFWIGLFAAVSFILRDLVNAGGSAGTVGNWLANLLCGLLGPIAFLIPLFMVVLSLRWKRFVKEGILAKKLLLSASFLWLLSGIVHVFCEGWAGAEALAVLPSALYTTGTVLQSGGIVGGFLGEWMGYLFYPVGTVLLAIPLLLIIGIYLIGMTPSGIWQRISTKLKMASERRAERRRLQYDGKEERTLRVKKATDKQEPQETAVEQASDDGRMHYAFDEDDDVQEQVKEKSTVQMPAPEKETVEEAVQAEPEQETELDEQEAPAPEMPTDTELVDIPDDIPEMDEPADDLQMILTRAGHSESAEERLNRILSEMAQQSEPEPAPTAPAEPAVAEQQEERVLQGTSYSPFALHRHIEPQQAQQQASASPAVEEKKTSYLTEEPLGSLNPIHREQKPAEAQRPAETEADRILSAAAVMHTPTAQVSAPVEETLAYRVVQTPAVAADSTPRFDTVQPQETPFDVPRASGISLEEAVSPITLRESIALPVEEPACVESTDVAPQPVAEEKIEQGGFSFAESVAKEDEVATPAQGIRMPFAIVEPAQEAPAVAEQSTVSFVREPVVEQPKPERPAPVERVIPMRPKPQVLTRTEPVKEEAKPTPPPPPRPYRLPYMDLLKEDTSIKENDHTEEMREKIDTLLQTLKSFNIRVKEQVDCSRGPTITRYELRPEPGVSVRSVMNRSDDISLNMAAPVRIEAPIPGKPAIGIEVPNAVRETVFMRTVLESDKYKSSTKPLEVPLGLDVGGDIQMCDLAKMPHLLVAGSTGSGKSVCINTILISLMYKTSPADLRLILIDPKQVEFTSYNHIPHLYAPIVTDAARAVGVLACAVQEMERRYSLIKDVGVRNIEGYNEAVKNDPEREHLPYMVIVIDEFADLKMACTNNDVETFTCRLAQKARAAGMHLIIGTQRPTVNIITGNLKNNIPSRIAFKVTQQTDSRTILDCNGAECLLGRGDMLYMTAGLPKPNRVQGAFVSDEEVEAVADYIRDHNDDVQYNQAFMEQIEAELARAAAANRKDEDDFGDDGDDGDEDPKFYEAVELAIETQKVATSLLQRRLGVGYGRAAKIIDRMEALGYVSAPEGNKARKVLITHAEYASMMEGDGGEGDY